MKNIGYKSTIDDTEQMTEETSEDIVDEVQELREEFQQYVYSTQQRSRNKRAENIQILVALGVVGLAGSLSARGDIQFPIIESIYSINYVQFTFRGFVYTTALFLLLKTITITLYPISNSSKFNWVHNRLEPFLYISSPVVILIISIIGVTVGEVTNNLLLAFIGMVALVVGTISGIYYSRMVAERRNKSESDKIKRKIIMKLLRRKATYDNKVPIETFKQWFVSNEADLVVDTVKQMADSSDWPVNIENGKIYITNIEKYINIKR